MERGEYLADRAKIAIQERKILGDLKYSSNFANGVEAGYALLRAASLHGFEVPVDDSPGATTVLFQSRVHNVSEKLADQNIDPEKLSLIFATAGDIIAINHPGEEVSDAEKYLIKVNKERQESEASKAVEAVEAVHYVEDLLFSSGSRDGEEVDKKSN